MKIVYGVTILVAGCWALTVAMAVDFYAALDNAVDNASLTNPWGDVSVWGLTAMWAIMMLAMMLPSFVPTLVLYTKLLRRQNNAEAAAPLITNYELRITNRQNAPADARALRDDDSTAAECDDGSAPGAGEESTKLAPAHDQVMQGQNCAAAVKAGEESTMLAPAHDQVMQGQNCAAAVKPRYAAVALVGGYAVVWAGFSLGISALQWAATASDFLREDMAIRSPLWSAALLIAAGAFQFSPLKFSCLKGCRHPAFFLMINWREGARGAAIMGAHNGLLCLGCCWALMCLLFVGGVMHLGWVAALTLYVLVEKLAPLPPLLLARAGGGCLIAAGMLQLLLFF